MQEINDFTGTLILLLSLGAFFLILWIISLKDDLKRLEKKFERLDNEMRKQDNEIFNLRFRR